MIISSESNLRHGALGTSIEETPRRKVIAAVPSEQQRTDFSRGGSSEFEADFSQTQLSPAVAHAAYNSQMGIAGRIRRLNQQARNLRQQSFYSSINAQDGLMGLGSINSEDAIHSGANHSGKQQESRECPIHGLPPTLQRSSAERSSDLNWPKKRRRGGVPRATPLFN